MKEKEDAKKITFGTYAIIVSIVFLVLLVCILIGIILKQSKEIRNSDVRIENNIAEDNNNDIKSIESNEEDDTDITEKEAKKILTESYEKLIDIHGSLDKFDVDSTGKIKNYNTLINGIFTDSGKKIYEKEMDGFITIKNGNAYFEPGDDHSAEEFKDFEIEYINIIDQNTISCIVFRTLKSSGLSDEEDEEQYESYMNEFKIKRVKGSWLIDKFTWSDRKNDKNKYSKEKSKDLYVSKDEDETYMEITKCEDGTIRCHINIYRITEFNNIILKYNNNNEATFVTINDDDMCISKGKIEFNENNSAKLTFTNLSEYSSYGKTYTFYKK